ncbi:MAG: hypothetical protein HY974_04400 [Candidatus Kerfeldbacteria bacterium]|nr:hypothetical protein [Candidatus Kerfeldbacteria bacterium]
MMFALRQIAELIWEFLLDVVRFPWWWYTGGLAAAARACWQGFAVSRARVSLGLGLRHFFTPMYGDYSLSGRAISLVMRLFLVVFKFLRLSLAGVWYLLWLAVWLLLLPVTVFMILA